MFGRKDRQIDVLVSLFLCVVLSDSMREGARVKVLRVIKEHREEPLEAVVGHTMQFLAGYLAELDTPEARRSMATGAIGLIDLAREGSGTGRIISP